MHRHYVYLNGEIMPVHEAGVSPLDIGLLRGYAVFDLLRTVGGRPFLLEEHLQRFRASAEHLGLTVPATDAEITAAIEELLERNKHAEATVRMVLTGGVSPDGMRFDETTPTLMVMTHELHEPSEDVYRNGVRLLIRHHRREVPEAKTTNYLTMLRHRHAVADAEAFDLLYVDDGVVSEAATASFYIVRDGRIIAPAEGVLWGTVGSYVLDLARPRFEIDYREFTLDETLAADEAFLTSTTRGVVPVVQLDEAVIGSGRVGPVTAELMELFRVGLAEQR